MKPVILFAAIVAVFVFYGIYSGVSKYIPVGQQYAS